MGVSMTPQYEPITKKQYPCWVVFLDRVARRIIDIIVSFLGLLILFPWFLVIGTIIKRDTPGPMFYRGSRIGKYGKKFKILKFRTMYEKHESYHGGHLTVNNDPRVTEAGRWLRDTKINELPQLWNVLLGQMSFVGPRPEDPEIFAEWPEQYKEKYIKVRPGITSPASLIFFDEENLISPTNSKKEYFKNILPAKLNIDLNYLNHRTVINDLDVLFMTFIALFPQMRKQSINEISLDKGPFISFFYGFFNWFIIDLFIATMATSASVLIWRLSTPINIGSLNAIALALLLAISFSLTNVLFGLNRIEWRHAPGEAIMDVGLSTGVAIIIIALLDALALRMIEIPLGILVLTGMLSFLGFSMARYRERLLTGLARRWLRLRGDTKQLGEQVIIIGAGELGIRTSWYIKHGYLGKVLSVIGFVDDNIYKRNMIFDNSPVLGGTNDLPELVKEHNVNILVFAIETISPYQKKKIEAICQQTGAQTIHIRNILDDVGSFIGPQSTDGEFSTSQENISKFLEQLDSLLEKNDVATARKFLKWAQNQLEDGEKEID